MFSSIIDGVNEKFDLGDKAGALISAILALMTDSANGGFAGFINRFRAVGLGDLADSWVSSGANTPVSYEQLESALGEDTLRGISEQVGTDYETTVRASEYVIPHLIDDLTPDGEIPNESDLLSQVGGYLTGVGTSSGGVGTSSGDDGNLADDGVGTSSGGVGTSSGGVGTSSGGVGTSSGLAGENIDRVDPADELTDKTEVAGVPGLFDEKSNGEENPLLAWLLPLLILVFLVVIGFWFCGGKSEPVAVPEANTNANTTNANAAK
jgi:uncharacterized protein YidB (DUF937 family)